MYGIEKGCLTHWTLLHFVLELLILKAKYGWSDYSFSDLLYLLSWVLPQPNLVPANTYQAKNVISPLTIGVKKIHACPNHCILFRGETFKSLDKCPRCGPAGTRTMTFTVGTNPPWGKRGIGYKKGGIRISTPRGHSIRQRCKAEKNSCLGNVVPANDRPLKTYLPKP